MTIRRKRETKNEQKKEIKRITGRKKNKREREKKQGQILEKVCNRVCLLFYLPLRLGLSARFGCCLTQLQQLQGRRSQINPYFRESLKNGFVQHDSIAYALSLTSAFLARLRSPFFAFLFCFCAPKLMFPFFLFRCAIESLKEGVMVCQSVSRAVGP